MSAPSGVKLNRLAREKSPYLLEHAANPVDWFPWGKEAFEKAAKEDKPVFLSIGYSACHWCHVMERESFEDCEVARLMNETFVCVKVDREERPDLDREYLEVCRTMTGGTGWPLTIIMTSSKKPFFAGTYFPRKACFNQAGMLELIPLIKDIWQTRRGELEGLAEAAVGGAAQQPAARRPGEPGESTLELAQANLAQCFDDINGGFGYAPKFPPAPNLVFLLRHWKRTGNRRSLAMVEKTLEAMSRGGIYDQVGHGFHRYATDRAWKVPHFEKMLYDQALLVMAYTEAWQATGRPLFKRIAREVCDYVLRDMTSPEGGFYSAEDADSEGKEGRFYTWTEAEIRKVLDKSEAEQAIKMLAVQPQGNFGSGPDENPDSANILRLAVPPAEERLEEEIRRKLFAERQKRMRPAKDDKILADWNGLMIAALAKAGRAFGLCAYISAAERAVDFMAAKMRGEDRRLLHRYRDGEAAVGGFLDDYAFLVWGLIELYQAGFDLRHLRLAAELVGILLDHFWDKNDGGFYFTADDATESPGRRKEIYDDMLPAGNAVAMLDLLRLSRMSGDVELEKKAAGLGSAFAAAVLQAPAAGAFFLVALDFALGPSYEVVVAGRSRDIETFDMLAKLAKAYIPNAVVMLRRAEQEPPDIDGFSSFTRYQPIVAGRTVAYACANGACAKPTPDIASLLDLFGAGSSKGAAE